MVLRANALAVAALAVCAASACRGAAYRSADTDARVHAADIDRLTGERWTGSLTYRDYTSGASTELRAALSVQRKPGSASVWVLHFAYADEPQADGDQELELAADGRALDGEAVIERRELANGAVRIVTQVEGQDNERAATLRHVYLIGAREASAQKLVRPAGASEFFERNIYRWRR